MENNVLLVQVQDYGIKLATHVIAKILSGIVLPVFNVQLVKDGTT
jgi:hypothetical protein